MIAGLYDIFKHWHTTGTVWLISDTHFNDEELYVGTKRIIRANSKDYVKLINSKVGKNDTLIHLGDVGDLDIMRQVRGYKVLIMGNHDSGVSNYQRRSYVEKFDADIYNRKQIIDIMKKKYPTCHFSVTGEYYDVQHSPFKYFIVIADNGLFDEVYSGPLMISDKIILSHEPVDVPWAFNIHGHIHAFNHKDDIKHLNICPDSSGNFEPINFNQLMKNGLTSKIKTIHRDTIDKATKRARKRGKKK